MDKDQIRHLRYNLLKDDDLNWTTALDVASRWEAANDYDDENQSSSDSDGEDSLNAVECVKHKRKSRKAGKAVTDSISKNNAVATLAEKVEENANNIQSVKSAQELLTANITSWRDETNETLKQILSALQMGQTGDED